MDALVASWDELFGLAASAGFGLATPGASPIDIDMAEARLRRKLPPNLRAWLSRSRAWGWREPRYDAVDWLPPDAIVEHTLKPALAGDQIEVEVSLSEFVRPIAYSNKRLTFAVSDNFRFQIDNDPAPGGRKGQIVAIDFEAGTIELVAESLDAFAAWGLAQIRTQLMGGYPHQGTVPLELVDLAAAVQIPRVHAPDLPVATQRPRPTRKAIAPARDALGRALQGIDLWLGEHAPADTKALKKGLTPLLIRRQLNAEAAWMPEELIPLFTTFNGQGSQREALLPCPLRISTGLLLHSLQRCLDVHSNQLGLRYLYQQMPGRRRYESDPRIKQGIWRKHWIPIASGWLDAQPHMGVMFVDLDPAPGGVHGQVVAEVVTMGAESEAGVRKVIAASVTEYFEALLADLGAGRCRYDRVVGMRWCD